MYKYPRNLMIMVSTMASKWRGLGFRNIIHSMSLYPPPPVNFGGSSFWTAFCLDLFGLGPLAAFPGGRGHNCRETKFPPARSRLLRLVQELLQGLHRGLNRTEANRAETGRRPDRRRTSLPEPKQSWIFWRLTALPGLAEKISCNFLMDR